MENKMKKTIALGAVIMLCAVAVIGVGYAAFNGNARTYNEGNSATSGYIGLVNGSFDPMIDSVVTEFDVYAAETATCYYFDDTSGAVTINTDYVGLAVGDEKALTVTNNTGSNITSLTIYIKADKANVGNADFPYFVKVWIDGITDSAQFLQMSTTAGTEVNAVFTDFGSAANVQVLADNDDTTEGAIKTVTIKMQFYIAYNPDYLVPVSGIGDVVTSIPDGKTAADYVDGKSSTTGPLDITGVGFGFRVVDSTS